MKKLKKITGILIYLTIFLSSIYLYSHYTFINVILYITMLFFFYFTYIRKKSMKELDK